MTLDAQPLLISVENIPSGRMLIVRGEVDLATAAQLRDALLRHLSAGRSLWLDLAGVTFMDSSGLHVLIAGGRVFGPSVRAGLSGLEPIGFTAE